MRIYSSFPQAFSEIRRDLGEMGLPVHTQTMQDKDISEDESFATVELTFYQYKVTAPKLGDLEPTQPWADAEWEEREQGCEGNPINPGIAYKLRPEIWDEFLHDGQFAYTYPERLAQHMQVRRVINRLRCDNFSRQLQVNIWRPSDALYLGDNRVPCSIHYAFLFRDGELHMEYYMRSCDFATHFQNDVYLALKLHRYVATAVGLPVGHFIHTIRSLHVYQKDVADVF